MGNDQGLLQAMAFFTRGIGVKGGVGSAEYCLFYGINLLTKEKRRNG